MNYDNCEHEYMELQSQFHQERMLEPTEPHDKGYLLVDDNQIEEPIGFSLRRWGSRIRNRPLGVCWG